MVDFLDGRMELWTAPRKRNAANTSDLEVRVLEIEYEG
jgi:hypothetical protein